MHFYKDEIATTRTTTYISNTYSISTNAHMRAMFTIEDNAPNGSLIDIVCLAQGNKGRYIKQFSRVYKAIEECLTLLLPPKEVHTIGSWLSSEFPSVDHVATEKKFDGLTVSAFVNRSKSSPHQAVKAEVENKR
ncbi:hypothetical protein Athai_21780 [Actinocatenispora thailandica]|uniref:Uncharacterized protein n=1 Tax=Actinocatenispora thailandica TaxID=227318 RepID=A0A7R7DMX1_9ACTN|nr:hypothetical protein Athai_21780 [Actinocatenispora thailandica]